jgi:hypothetical protein
MVPDTGGNRPAGAYRQIGNKKTLGTALVFSASSAQTQRPAFGINRKPALTFYSVFNQLADCTVQNNEKHKNDLLQDIEIF